METFAEAKRHRAVGIVIRQTSLPLNRMSTAVSGSVTIRAVKGSIRRRRRSVAAIIALALLFAQFFTALHACPIIDVVSQSSAIAAGSDDTMPSDCAALA